MSELMLCKRPIAAQPYYIDEASLNIYSLEELSYYIYNNTDNITNEFVSVDLCNWIGRELDLRDLEKKLLEFIAEDVSTSIFINHLLREVAYLTEAEIKLVVDNISIYENKSDVERRKIRADKLLDSNKYNEAIFAYDNMLNRCTSPNFTKELRGDIYHNLGVCYARLFFFEEACESFDMAYSLNKRRDSLESLLIAHKCNKDEVGFREACSKYFVPDEMQNRIIQVIKDTASSKDILDFDTRLKQLKITCSSDEQYLDKINNIIDTWQNDYLKLC